MRVLVVGATGALGRPLVTMLAAGGHEVVAAGRQQPSDLPTAGVEPIALDLLDPAAVRAAVDREGPEAIVHFATAIPHEVDPRKIGRQFATTNRLRTEGTRNLLAAARASGVERFVAQGLAYAYEPGDAIRTERDPIWPTPPKAYAPVAAALRQMEDLVGEFGGTVLRLGHIYGPGTIYAADGSMTTAIGRGKVPLVGDGAARFSFIHVEDVASAVLAALDHPGDVFNIVDDEPLPVHDWLPWYAQYLGARPPKRIPVGLARLAVGPFGVAFMNGLAGASNAHARRTLDWRPHFPTFRDGIRNGPRGAVTGTGGTSR